MFDVSEKDRQTETTCCGLSEISNHCIMSQTLCGRLIVLMHDLDLFTLQSIECIPVRSLTRSDSRSFVCGKYLCTCGVLTLNEPAIQDVVTESIRFFSSVESLVGQWMSNSNTILRVKKKNGAQRVIIRERERTFICGWLMLVTVKSLQSPEVHLNIHIWQDGGVKKRYTNPSWMYYPSWISDLNIKCGFHKHLFYHSPFI